MSRKARNKKADAVLTFWEQLTDADKIECFQAMAARLVPAKVAPIDRPKRVQPLPDMAKQAPL